MHVINEHCLATLPNSHQAIVLEGIYIRHYAGMQSGYCFLGPGELIKRRANRGDGSYVLIEYNGDIYYAPCGTRIEPVGTDG